MHKKTKTAWIFIIFIIIFCPISAVFNYIHPKTSEILNYEEDKNIQASLTELWRYNNSGSFWGVSITADGSYTATIRSNTVYLFNKNNSIPIWSYSYSHTLYSVKISSDGNYIVVGSYSGLFLATILLFNVSDSYALSTYIVPGSNSPASNLDISANGSYFVALIDEYFYVFNKSSTTYMWRYTIPYGFYLISISANGEYITVTGDDTYVYFFKISNPSPIWGYYVMSWVYALDISDDGRFVAAGTGDMDCAIYYFNASDSITPLLWSRYFGASISSISISENGSYCVASDYTNGVYYFNYSSPLSEWEDTTISGASIVDITADGKYVIAGDTKDTLYLYNASMSSNPLLSSYNVSNFIDSLDMCSDGRYIAVSVSDFLGSILLFYGPYPPGNFTLSKDTGDIDYDGNFNLIWNKSEGAHNYTIYTFDKPITEINESLTVLETNYTYQSYSLTGLENGTYFYAITAHNQFGNTTTNCVNVTVIRYPPFPFNLSSNANSPEIDGNFTLTWNSSSLALYYTVYECNKTITTINSSVTTLVPFTTYLNHSITNKSNGEYYYLIKAFNNNGNTSTNCINVSVERPPSNFSILSNTTGIDTDGNFMLTWNNTFQADNYTVYMYNSSITEINDTLTMLANMTSELCCIVPTLTNGTYYFIVVAHNQFGNTTSNCIFVQVEIPPNDEGGEGPGGPGEPDDEDGFDWGDVAFWGTVTGGAVGAALGALYFIRPELFKGGTKTAASLVETVGKKRALKPKKKKKKKKIIICPKCANENFAVNDICFKCSSDLKLEKIKTLNIVKHLLKDTGSLKVGVIELFYPSIILKKDTFTISCLLAQQNAKSIKIRMNLYLKTENSEGDYLSQEDLEVEVFNSKPLKLSFQIKAEESLKCKFMGKIISINDNDLKEEIDFESKDMLINVIDLDKAETNISFEESELGKTLIPRLQELKESESLYLEYLSGKFQILAAKNLEKIVDTFNDKRIIGDLMKLSQEINDILILTNNNFKFSLDEYNYSELYLLKEAFLDSIEKLFILKTKKERKKIFSGLFIEEKIEDPNYKTYPKVFLLHKTIMLLRLQKIRILKLIHDFSKSNNIDIDNLNLQ